MQVEHGSGPISVQISGKHLAGSDTTVLGRCQGKPGKHQRCHDVSPPHVDCGSGTGLAHLRHMHWEL